LNDRTDRSAGARAKITAASVSFVVTLVLLAGKGSVALATGSLVLLAVLLDAVFDVVGNGMTLVAVRVSARPPDVEHPYGHSKIESVAALGELVVIVAGVSLIVVSAVGKMLSGAETPRNLGWGLAVLATMFVTDAVRSTYLKKVARRHGSHALEADALNFRMDMLTASVAMIGIGSTMLGASWADPVGSLAVVAIITFSAFRLGRKAVDALMDSAPTETAALVRAVVERVPEVERVGKLRLRGSPGAYFGDVLIGVSASLPFGEARAVAERVRELVADEVPDLDIIVRVEPVAVDGSPLTVVHEEAARLRADIHHVSIDTRPDGTYEIAYHQLLPADMPLREAHADAKRLECAIADRFEGLLVHAHLEEIPKPTSTRSTTTLDDVVNVARKAATDRFGDQVKKVSVSGGAEAPRVTIVLSLASDVPLEKAHRTAEEVEHVVRTAVPNAGRVTIRTEPKA
jgi:cation diffusion facilitator family transporter